MSCFVWCKKEQCRIPAFRCLLCKDGCYAGHGAGGWEKDTLEGLIRSGKYKERFVMRRKGSAAAKDESAEMEIEVSAAEVQGEPEVKESRSVYLMEEGKLKPFSPQDYTASTLYEVLDSFSVECRLVRPDDPGSIQFEGKRPSRKTVPVVVSRSGDCALLDSWDALEAKPEQLADAVEVMGVVPVRQAFVLRRKQD